MLVERQEFELFADFHQFYLWDRNFPLLDDIEPYTDDDVQRRLKTAPHVVIINPERNMTVRVTVEIHDTEPSLKEDAWDHIVEASLNLPTGNLQVHECTGGLVADLILEPGWYRVISFHGGFATINDTGLEGDDHYLAVLWPAPESDVKVIKQWSG